MKRLRLVPLGAYSHVPVATEGCTELSRKNGVQTTSFHP